ncbi:T9SS type A sorting domain-containing protein [Aquimarina agarilytica]|uniref:T9SS type A sorting domain-containing protein n=1 Tax=Aquimarina agarilytica TaxID=1087449 RepID=UPI000288555F|nr:T9SS type A sorting domain-containing protein [Aquimarina agarilytica]
MNANQLSIFRKSFILSLFSILFLGNLYAKDIYVAKNGSNSNNGTKNSPFKTIQKAADVVQAGDVIFIRRGVYKEKITVRKSGTAGKWIKIKAYPGDEKKAIIDGTPLLILRSSYIEVSGIRVQNVHVTNGRSEGIYVEGPASNIVLKNNHTFNTRNSGIAVWGVGFKKNLGNLKNIRNVKVLNNKVEKACNGGYNECITLSNGIIDFEIVGNEIFNGGNPINGGEGIDIKVGIQNGKIADNYVHDLTRRGIYLDANGSVGETKPFVKNVKIYNNVSVRNVGHGLALMTEGIGDVSDIDVYNNLFHNNTDDGIMIFNHPKGTGNVFDIRIFNNTMAFNKRKGFLLAHPRSFDIKLYNNIIWGSEDNGSKRSQRNKDYSISAGKATENNNLIAVNPQFVNVNNGNYRLKKNSPAIDKGIASGAPREDLDNKNRNGKIDIGAYEFGAASNGGNPRPSTPAPTPVSNNNGPVTLYENCNFNGKSVNLNIGDYANFNTINFANDALSAIKIKSGFEVILYSDGGFRGRSITLKSDDTCLINNGFNDVVSSIKIKTTSNGGNNGGSNGQLLNDDIYTINSFKTKQNIVAPDWYNHQARVINNGNFKDQRWIFKHQGANFYTIQNERTKRYLRVEGNECNLGSKIFTENNALRWKIEKFGNTYVLKPDYCQQKALDVARGQNDADVQLWDFNKNNGNQKWVITKATGTALKTLEANDTQDLVKIYPNPTSEILYINNVAPLTAINVYDLNGLINKFTSDDQGQFSLNVSSLAKGLYMLKINTRTYKFVVK